jgi:hypothetical protein
MKRCLPPIIFSILFVTCKKNIQVEEVSSDFPNLKQYIRLNLSSSEYNSLQFDKAVLYTFDAQNNSILYVPYRNSSVISFILVEVDQSLNPLKTRMIALFTDQVSSPASPLTAGFNGSIIIKSLNGEELVNSLIRDGEILSFRISSSVTNDEQLAIPKSILPAPNPVVPDGTYLPEVIVIGHPTGGGLSYSTWVNFLTIMNAAPNGNPSGYYNYVSSYGGSGGSQGPGPTSPQPPGSGGSPKSVPSILVDFEKAQPEPAIDLLQYLKCFSTIPDDGATCSIEIFVDIPVDSDPWKILNISTESVGHTFLQIKKSNGLQRVTQNIGFYPVSRWKTAITNAPIPGKFVDNANHEFNASLKMNLSPEQLSSVIIHMQALNNYVRYDIDDYNCTDFALDVFNYVRIDPIIPMPVEIPGGMRQDSNTPQGLYMALDKMKKSGHPEAANIWLSPYKGYTGASNGPCN